MAFLGIYILDGEFDTFSYLGGFVPLDIYIYGDFATLFPYLDGFVRLSIYIYIKHFEKIFAKACLIAEMVGVAINKRSMKKKT